MAGSPYQKTPLGLSFFSELEDAGLADVAWQSDGTIEGFDDMPPDRQEKIKALIRRHDPSAPFMPSKRRTEEMEKILIERGSAPVEQK